MAAATAVIAGSALVAGNALQVYGSMKANAAQAQAERENAQYLEEQAGFIREAGRRSLDTFEQEAEQFRGAQVSGFSAGGVALTGSPLAVLAGTLGSQLKEKDAIKLDFKAKEREALLKAGASYKKAAYLSDWRTKFLPAAGMGLQTAGQLASMGGK